MFNKLKEKLSDLSTKGLQVQITNTMLEQLIGIKSGEQGIKVNITPNQLILNGTTEVKKMMLKKTLSYTIILKPVRVDKRTIVFKLVDMKPLDMNIINNKIFNKPPFLEYHNREVKIDFNSWDVVKKTPVGNIKSFELIDNAIEIKIAL